MAGDNYLGHLPFERLEAEVVVVEVTVEDEGRIETVLVLLDDAVHVLGNQARTLPGLRVNVFVQPFYHLAEDLSKDVYICMRVKQQKSPMEAGSDEGIRARK